MSNKEEFPARFTNFKTKLQYAYMHQTYYNLTDSTKLKNKHTKKVSSRKISYSGYGDTTSCKRHKNHPKLKELFALWIRMANLFNVSYALTHGTLLGALRDENLIPYDHDMDIMIDHAEIPKFSQMIDTSFNEHDYKFHLTIQREYQRSNYKRNRYSCEGYLMYPWYRDVCSYIEPVGRLVYGPHLYLDLVGYKIIGKSLFNFQTEDKIHEFDVKDMLPYTECNFLGFRTFCPRNSTVLMTKVYGSNYMDSIKKCRNGDWK
uniref:LicD/FKTN/FKRP nucleotidyltransferase domain-containing protein n=2 Tax=Clytia hemisphaerica TaxID=252671 RepID=A0A7M5XEB1_9CNID